MIRVVSSYGALAPHLPAPAGPRRRARRARRRQAVGDRERLRHRGAPGRDRHPRGAARRRRARVVRFRVQYRDAAAGAGAGCRPPTRAGASAGAARASRDGASRSPATGADPARRRQLPLEAHGSSCGARGASPRSATARRPAPTPRTSAPRPAGSPRERQRARSFEGCPVARGLARRPGDTIPMTYRRSPRCSTCSSPLPPRRGSRGGHAGVRRRDEGLARPQRGAAHVRPVPRRERPAGRLGDDGAQVRRRGDRHRRPVRRDEGDPVLLLHPRRPRPRRRDRGGREDAGRAYGSVDIRPMVGASFA